MEAQQKNTQQFLSFQVYARIRPLIKTEYETATNAGVEPKNLLNIVQVRGDEVSICSPYEIGDWTVFYKISYLF